MILILGKGSLGSALHAHFDGSTLVGRPEFDLSTQHGCDSLLGSFDPTIVINTVAVNEAHDPWEIFTTNFTSVVYLTLGFYEKMVTGQIINISSTSTLWTSHPDISTGRLCYNLSKDCVSQFGRHFNRKIVDAGTTVVLTTLEIGKFPSRFNGFQPGMDIDHVVDIIDGAVKRPVQQLTVIK